MTSSYPAFLKAPASQSDSDSELSLSEGPIDVRCYGRRVLRLLARWGRILEASFRSRTRSLGNRTSSLKGLSRGRAAGSASVDELGRRPFWVFEIDQSINTTTQPVLLRVSSMLSQKKEPNRPIDAQAPRSKDGADSESEKNRDHQATEQFWSRWPFLGSESHRQLELE